MAGRPRTLKNRDKAGSGASGNCLKSALQGSLDRSPSPHGGPKEAQARPSASTLSYPPGPGAMSAEATVMLQFGALGQQYAAEVEQGTLVRSMIGLGAAR